MTEEQIKKVSCYYCKEQINSNAKICSHCGYNQKRYRQWFNQYINHAATIISIFFLVVACLQYNEAKKEREEAKKALVHAQKAEEKITDSGKAIAKTLLVLSTIKGDYDSLGILELFPKVMKNAAESLLNTIEVNDKERQDILELYNKLKEWQQLSDSEQKEKLGKEIDQLISR